MNRETFAARYLDEINEENHQPESG